MTPFEILYRALERGLNAFLLVAGIVTLFFLGCLVYVLTSGAPLQLVARHLRVAAGPALLGGDAVSVLPSRPRNDLG